MRLEQFHIIAQVRLILSLPSLLPLLTVETITTTSQVGQGGYGEVYLARRIDTGEVCALKKMKKKTLHKMDEVCLSLQFIASYDFAHSICLDPFVL